MKHFVFGFIVIGIAWIGWLANASNTPTPLETTAVVDRLIEFTDRHPVITPHDLLETLIVRKQHLPQSSPTLPVLEGIIEILITHYYTPTDLLPTVAMEEVTKISPHADSFETYTWLTSYMVMDAETITPVINTEQNSLRHQQIRLLLTHIFPARYLRNITGYHVYDNFDSHEVAALYTANQWTGRRDIVINAASLFPDGTLEMSSIFHLLHELWHLITLDMNQFTTDTESTCTTYRVDEGCLKSDAYLYQFVLQFRWTGEYGSIDSYAETDFVSEYAKINPVEDIAESFAVYVMESPPFTQTTADKKVQFFSQFDHFALLKSQILKVLSGKNTKGNGDTVSSSSSWTISP